MVTDTSLDNLKEMHVKIIRELSSMSKSYHETDNRIKNYEKEIHLWRERAERCNHIARRHVGPQGKEDFDRLREEAIQMQTSLQDAVISENILREEKQTTYHKLKDVSAQFKNILERKDLDSLFKNMSMLKNTPKHQPAVRAIGQDVSQRKITELMFEAQALISLQEGKGGKA